MLGHKGDIVIGVDFHFLINPLRGGALGAALEEPQQLVLSQRMRGCTLQGSIRWNIRYVFSCKS